MSMVVISTPVFDLFGVMRFTHLDTGTELTDATRRVSRTATLDGGASVYDGGFSHADRVLTVAVSPFSVTQLENVKRLFQTYPELNVSCRDGAYRCAAESYRVSSTTLTLRFLVIRSLTEAPTG